MSTVRKIEIQTEKNNESYICNPVHTSKSVYLLCRLCEKETQKLICEDPLGRVNIATGAPVVISVMQALTDSASVIGGNHLAVIELALSLHGDQFF